MMLRAFNENIWRVRIPTATIREKISGKNDLRYQESSRKTTEQENPGVEKNQWIFG